MRGAAAATDGGAGAGALTAERMAALYKRPLDTVQVYHHPAALAMKVSFDRWVPAGSVWDTDLYGAQQHVLLYDIDIP